MRGLRSLIQNGTMSWHDTRYKGALAHLHYGAQTRTAQMFVIYQTVVHRIHRMV